MTMNTTTNYPVEIIRSARRKRTVEAKLVNGTIHVHVPARMSKADVEVYAAELVAKIQRKNTITAADLTDRTLALARRYDLPVPHAIRFVDNQRTQWGSCTPATREIRLSSRLAEFPSWVLDYVIVHELAHLVVYHHNAKFHALVARYPQAERARGFLYGVHYSPVAPGETTPAGAGHLTDDLPDLVDLVDRVDDGEGYSSTLF
jgi:predicted metal-dependent hydrolase